MRCRNKKRNGLASIKGKYSENTVRVYKRQSVDLANGRKAQNQKTCSLVF